MTSRCWLLLAVTLGALGALPPASCARDFVGKAEADGFTALPRPQAVAAAKDLAARDFAAGRFRVWLISKVKWNEAYEDYLRDRHGIRYEFLSLPQPEKAYRVAHAYNEAMKALLKQKFHADVFENARVATGQTW